MGNTYNPNLGGWGWRQASMHTYAHMYLHAHSNALVTHTRLHTLSLSLCKRNIRSSIKRELKCPSPSRHGVCLQEHRLGDQGQIVECEADVVTQDQMWEAPIFGLTLCCDSLETCATFEQGVCIFPWLQTPLGLRKKINLWRMEETFWVTAIPTFCQTFSITLWYNFHGVGCELQIENVKCFKIWKPFGVLNSAISEEVDTAM